MCDLQKYLADTILADCIQPSVDISCLNNLFLASKEANYVNKSSVLPELIGYVNTALNTGSSRVQGLLILCHILDQCSADVLIQNGQAWANLLLRAAQSRNDARTRALTAEVLSRLLSLCPMGTELSRHIASNVIPGVLPVLLGAEKKWLAQAMSCLVGCIDYFPGPCGPFKFKIEQQLCRLLDGSYEESLERDAGRCYALLARCGGEGTRQSECWTLLADKLLGSLHTTLDRLYQEVEIDSEEYSCPGIKLALPHVAGQGGNQLYWFQRRYRALATATISMLSVPQTFAAHVPVEDLLGIVCRTLAITPTYLLLRPTSQRAALAAQVPALHTHALKLLGTLIASLNSLLMPYSATVNKIFTQLLVWTSVEQSDRSAKPFLPLRTKVYKTLTLWLVTCGACTGLESTYEKIVAHSLRDAGPSRSNAKPESSALAGLKQMEHIWRPSKKKRQVQLVAPSSGQVMHAFASEELGVTALEMLKQLISTNGSIMKPTHHKMIQDFCVERLLHLQSQPCGRGVEQQIELAAYQLLLSCVQHPHPSWPAPVHPAVLVFSRGQHTVDRPQVSEFCQQAVLVCEGLVHPRAASFNTRMTSHESGSCMEGANKRLEAILDLDTSTARINPDLVQIGRPHTRMRSVSESLIHGPSEDNPIDLVSSQEVSSAEEDEKVDEEDAGIHQPSVTRLSDSPDLSNISNGRRRSEDGAIQLNSDDSGSSRSPTAVTRTLHVTDDVSKLTGGDDVRSLELSTGRGGNPELTDDGTASSPCIQPSTASVVDSVGEGAARSPVRKRKLDQIVQQDEEEPVPKQLDLMLQSFVDAEPDSDNS